MTCLPTLLILSRILNYSSTHHGIKNICRVNPIWNSLYHIREFETNFLYEKRLYKVEAATVLIQNLNVFILGEII